VIRYRDYTAVMEVDAEAGLIFGHTIGMADEVTFQGGTVAEAEESFRRAVDFYLECCVRDGRVPGRPFTGEFRVGIAPEQHRALVHVAERLGLGVNEACGRAIAEFLERIGMSEQEDGGDKPVVAVAEPAAQSVGT